MTVSLSRLLKNDDEFVLSDYDEYSLLDRRITDTTVTKFTTLLRNDTALCSIKLIGNNNKISCKVWKSLVETIMFHPSITYIKFYSDALCLQRAIVLADVLQQQNPSSGVRKKSMELEFDCCTLQVEGFSLLFDALRNNHLVDQLTVTDPHYGKKRKQDETESDDDNRLLLLGQSIGKFLYTNTTVKKLDFRRKHWGDNVVTELATIGIKSNTYLTDLDCSYNNIHDSGAIAIGTALRYNHYLIRLNLSNNQIGDDGAIAIGTALRYNHCLKFLYLNDNPICDDGAIAIAESLRCYCNSSLEWLQLARNNITKQGFMAFGDAIKYNTHLRKLRLSNNRNCTDIDTVSLIYALEYNTTLGSLVINQEIKTLEGEKTLPISITPALEYNDTIKCIDCSWPLSLDQEEIIKNNYNPHWDPNQPSSRIAPKKGGRIRSDMYRWLLTKWVHNTILCHEYDDHQEIRYSATKINTAVAPKEAVDCTIQRKRKAMESLIE